MQRLRSVACATSKRGFFVSFSLGPWTRQCFKSQIIIRIGSPYLWYGTCVCPKIWLSPCQVETNITTYSFWQLHVKLIFYSQRQTITGVHPWPPRAKITLLTLQSSGWQTANISSRSENHRSHLHFANVIGSPWSSYWLLWTRLSTAYYKVWLFVRAFVVYKQTCWNVLSHGESYAQSKDPTTPKRSDMYPARLIEILSSCTSWVSLLRIQRPATCWTSWLAGGSGCNEAATCPLRRSNLSLSNRVMGNLSGQRSKDILLLNDYVTLSDHVLTSKPAASTGGLWVASLLRYCRMRITFKGLAMGPWWTSREAHWFQEEKCQKPRLQWRKVTKYSTLKS